MGDEFLRTKLLTDKASYGGERLCKRITCRGCDCEAKLAPCIVRMVNKFIFVDILYLN